jgi:hypothetical protein
VQCDSRVGLCFCGGDTIEMKGRIRLPEEQPLHGGRTTTGVVKVRETVRRPRSQNSAFVERLLEHLEARSFHGAPRHLGLDEAGRDVFTYIPGEVPADLGFFTDAQLTAAARLLRSYHDATMDLPEKGAAEVICHGDPSPCNYVFAQGLPHALIDFDDAHPGSRRDDLGYAAWLWLDIGNDEFTADVQHRRLRKFVDDYGLQDDRQPGRLVRMAQARHASNSQLPDHVRQWSAECLAWTNLRGWD